MVVMSLYVCCSWELKVETPEDLNRQVVKTDYTSVKIPELDFEIPAQSQAGGTDHFFILHLRGIDCLKRHMKQRGTGWIFSQ